MPGTTMPDVQYMPRVSITMFAMCQRFKSKQEPLHVHHAMHMLGR
jgi:hypothetical protein